MLAANRLITNARAFAAFAVPAATPKDIVRKLSDTLIEAGAEALRINPAFRDFLSSVGGTPRPVRRHVPPFKRAPAAR